MPNETVQTVDGDTLHLFLRMTLSEQQALVHDDDMDLLANSKAFAANLSAVDKVTTLLMNLQYL
jgi:hypothetical protein